MNKSDKPSRSKKPSTKAKSANAAVNTPNRVPNIKWVKSPDWTWALITYLTDHPAFRKKLFSDSTADANKEGRNKAVGKDGKPQQYAVLAKHIFENDATQSGYYAKTPVQFATSVETRLRR
ncbi:hypothetical protein B0H34DRAFT_686254 [Crassisporium funariophilum]|nr:hypothetical protein B0H34DRAFT_686254 [Crassisporium funariophilum]